MRQSILIAKQRKTAIELSKIIKAQLEKGADLRIAVYAEGAHGWRAKVYSSDSSNQVRVNVVVSELRERYDLEEWRN